MNYISTRTPDKNHSLAEAAFLGLAPDGGLFMPGHIPSADLDEVLRRAGISYNWMTEYLAGLFFGRELTQKQVEQVVGQAYDFRPQLRRLSGSLHTLELFHGPTFAFKDFGARFMGRMLGVLNEDTGRERIILTATSGDTGSAVAAGFYRVPGVRVVLLYPAGRISDLQESQMTTLGGNIRPLRIEGSFDDCQRMAKEIFSDHAFCRDHGITSANSINILRWIPQAFYYFYGYRLWLDTTGRAPGDPVEIAVPSGNYGNLSAGMLARRIGLPVSRFIAASNANDIVPHLLETGEYLPRESVATPANAMDVGAPSNYERMEVLCGGDLQALRQEVKGFSASDAEIRRAIAEIKEQYGYWSDPHSAVGYLAACRYEIDGFWLSTAHEAKFREVLAESLPPAGMPRQLPPELARRLSLPREFVRMAADTQSLRRYLQES